MDVLDATIVNVALPSIKRDLGFAQSDLAWVLNAYLIAFGGLLLLAGRVGDLIGVRRGRLIAKNPRADRPRARSPLTASVLNTDQCKHASGTHRVAG